MPQIMAIRSITDNCLHVEQLDWVKSKLNSTFYTTFSQLTRKSVDRLDIIYKDGELFSGTAWSSDGATMKIIVDRGVLTRIYVFHDNGSVAMCSIEGNGRVENYYFDDSKKVERNDGEYYGNEMDKYEFRKKYKTLYTRVRIFWKEIKKAEEY
jgi:hypothetical protein